MPLILLSFLSLVSCEQEVCTDPGCLDEQKALVNDCAPGFEGHYCEVPKINKFLGNYTQTGGVCLEGKTRYGNHRIVEVPGDFTRIQILSSDLNEPLDADIHSDEWNFTIPVQMNSVTDPETGELMDVEVSGLGWIEKDNNKLYYKLNHRQCRYEFRYR